MSELRGNLDTLPAGALRTEVLERGEEIGAAAVPTYLDHLTRAERRGDASEATLIRYTLTRMVLGTHAEKWLGPRDTPRSNDRPRHLSRSEALRRGGAAQRLTLARGAGRTRTPR